MNSDDELFATAYIASQQDVIAKFGIEVTEPFGPYKTYQTSIKEIESLTGLKFVCGANGKKALSDYDPLSKPSTRRKRRVRSAEESMGAPSLPPGYFEINGLEDIQLKP